MQSLPRFQFPNSFSLSVNEKHYSNTQESLKFYNEIIILHIKEVHSSYGLSANQYASVIMDVFTGQMTSDLLNLFRDNKILLTNVPANMTKLYQPLNLTVNGYAKRFMARKFNHRTSGAAEKIIDSGCTSSCIEEAINMVLISFPSIDPFSDIAPIMVELNETSLPFHNHAICDLSPELKSIGYLREDVLDEEEEVWGPVDDRNIFDVIDEFDDENENLLLLAF